MPGRAPASACRLERMISIWLLSASAPWVNFYGNTPKSIDYPRKTMYQLLSDTARRYPQNIAYVFMGKETDYATFLRRVDLGGQGLCGHGHPPGGPGDHLHAEFTTGCGLLLCPEPDWCQFPT